MYENDQTFNLYQNDQDDQSHQKYIISHLIYMGIWIISTIRALHGPKI